MVSRKNVGLSLLAWAAGMLSIIGLNAILGLPEQFTLAHVVGAACVGSLVDYLLFCRRPGKEAHVCEVCFRSLGARRCREVVEGGSR
jgi:hypothetical protein